MKRIIALAALAATVAGCVGDLPPDDSLADRDHPANPAALAATRPTLEDLPAATQPTPAPVSTPAGVDHSHHQHGGGAR